LYFLFLLGWEKVFFFVNKKCIIECNRLWSILTSSINYSIDNFNLNSLQTFWNLEYFLINFWLTHNIFFNLFLISRNGVCIYSLEEKILFFSSKNNLKSTTKLKFQILVEWLKFSYRLFWMLLSAFHWTGNEELL
jgi:hypothetical protein